MRPLITSALIAASLTLAGNGAMAADIQVQPKKAAAPAHAAAHIVVRHRYPVARYSFARPPVGMAQIIGGLLAGPWLAPYVAHYAGRMRIAHGSEGTYVPYDPPTNDSPSPPDTSVQDSLNAQAEAQAIQQMNDTNAMTASMAAAAAQAAADSAAETQQIMNNGGL